MLGYSLGDPGDAILVARPIYGRFELDFGNTAGLEIVYADMASADPFEEEVVGTYEHALAEARSRGLIVKVLLIVNPNNPLGKLRFCFKSHSASSASRPDSDCCSEDATQLLHFGKLCSSARIMTCI